MENVERINKEKINMSKMGIFESSDTSVLLDKIEALEKFQS